MKGKHVRHKKHRAFIIVSICLCMIIGFCLYQHFKPKPKEDYRQYQSFTGQIAMVGDETLLIRDKTNKEYLVSIAGIVDSNKALMVGNSITIYYEGYLDVSNADIQDVKVKKYIARQYTIANKKNAYITQTLSNKIQNMSLEDKISQLFLLKTSQNEYVHAPGGILLSSSDFKDKSKKEVEQLINSYQEDRTTPLFIAIDEEGGTVTRISQYHNHRFLSPSRLYQNGGFDAIQKDTKEKDQYLKEMGINLNLSPVCDIARSNQDFIYPRTLKQDEKETGKYVKTVVKQMNKDSMGNCLKHFPGYSSHTNMEKQLEHDSRTKDELLETDLVPFKDGVKQNANMILMSHIIMDNIDQNQPMSLSLKGHEFLREELKYNGLIISDDLSSEAIMNDKDKNDVIIQSIKAGNDMIIIDSIDDLDEIVGMINEQNISLNDIDRSVLRILYYKQSLKMKIM